MRAREQLGEKSVVEAQATIHTRDARDLTAIAVAIAVATAIATAIATATAIVAAAAFGAALRAPCVAPSFTDAASCTESRQPLG